jgi:hypothetical protein
MSERDLVYPDINWCPNCGERSNLCQCTEDDMNRWAAEVIDSWEWAYEPAWKLYPLEIESPYEEYDDDDPY